MRTAIWSSRWRCVPVLMLLGLALWGCGSAPERAERSVATLSPVRGTVSVSAEGSEAQPSAAVMRLAPGQTVSVDAASLAQLWLDEGASLLIDADSALQVSESDALSLSAGRLFVMADPGEALSLEVAGAALRITDASVSVAVTEGGARLYVVRGEVSYRAGDESAPTRGVVRSGEELTLGAGAPAISAAILVDDWTGGLMRPGPDEASVPPGMGVLEARVPDEVGQARWPLSIRRLDVRVRVEQELAVTEVTQEFFNPASETVEGLYRIRVPEDAVLVSFSVDRAGTMVEGYVRERATAAAAYDAEVYRGSTDDPALLEWDAPGRYRARIYPIAAGEVRTIAIRYAQWLPRTEDGRPRLYRYPLGQGGARAPVVGELSFVADLAHAGAARVRAGLGAAV